MATAGRAVVFSGLTVALGLALLLAVPVPFIRSLGVAGPLVPLVSVAAATTLQPALLSLLGRRGARRRCALLRGGLRLRLRAGERRGFWARLARAIMAGRSSSSRVGAALLGVAPLPWPAAVTPGSTFRIPPPGQAVTGLRAPPERRSARAPSPPP